MREPSKYIRKAAIIIALLGVGLPMLHVLRLIWRYPVDYRATSILLAVSLLAVAAAVLVRRIQCSIAWTLALIVTLIFGVISNARTGQYHYSRLSIDMLHWAITKGPDKAHLTLPYFLYRFYRECTFLAAEPDMLPSEMEFVGRINVEHVPDLDSRLNTEDENRLLLFIHKDFSNHNGLNYHFIQTESDLRLKAYDGTFVVLSALTNIYIVPEPVYTQLTNGTLSASVGEGTGDGQESQSLSLAKSDFLYSRVLTLIADNRFEDALMHLDAIPRQPEHIDGERFSKLHRQHRDALADAAAKVASYNSAEISARMHRQTILLFDLYLLGVVLGLIARRRMNILFICCAGLPAGIAAWVISTLIFISLGIPYSISSIGLLCLTVALAALIFIVRQRSISVADLVLVFGISTIFYLFLTKLSAQSYAIFSGDSWGIVTAGRAIAYERGLGSPMFSEELGKLSLVTYVIQSMAVFANLDYFYAVLPALAVSFFACFFLLTFQCIGYWRRNYTYRFIVSSLATLLLCTTQLIFDHIPFMHTNLMCGGFLFLFVASAWIGIKEGHGEWALFSILFFIAFVFSRAETPLFGLVFLILILSSNELPERAAWKISMACLIPIAIVFAKIALVIQTGKYLSPFRVLGMGFLLCSYCGLTLARGLPKVQTLLKHMPVIMLYCIFGGSVAVFVMKPAFMGQCLFSILENMSHAGNWSTTWFVLVPLFCAALLRKVHFPCEHIFSYGLSCSLVLLYELGIFRAYMTMSAPLPYYARPSDSANRILIHLAFPLILYVVLKCCAKQQTAVSPGRAHDDASSDLVCGGKTGGKAT